ncbi:MAG: transcription termination factor NusA [Candidatus Omnitrophica bacterium]|nr:transcription termination factor NusA [Candidatus Omnitrophota bacterium]
MKKEIISLLEYWEKEKGIERNYLIESLEDGLLTVYRKKAGLSKDIKIKIDPETGDIKFINETGEEIPPPTFQWERIAAQTAKYVLMQKLKEAERNTIYDEFKKLEGELVSGKVERFENENVVVVIGKAEGILPHHHKLPNDHFKIGDGLKCYLLEVRPPSKGNYQLILSRTHPNFIKKLLENEIPEIKEGIIEIKGIARFPGDLTKVAVLSKKEKVEPIGTCVGDKAGRIKNIIKELKGEKIEIIQWDEDITKFIKNSLSPAKANEVYIDEDKKEAVVIVSDDQLFLAIGKKGQNVRLASKLIGWNIRVFKESEYKNENLSNSQKI